MAVRASVRRRTAKQLPVVGLVDTAQQPECGLSDTHGVRRTGNEDRPLGFGLVERLLDEFHRGNLDRELPLDHALNSSLSCSQARVAAQRRLTVATDMPVASATSSSVIPP